MLEIGDFGRRPITREHDLFMSIKQRVERVKEFLLRPFLTRQKLNVVDKQEIRLTISFAELNQRVVLNGVDKFIDKNFARKIHHARRLLFTPDILTDRLHQVGLAQTDAAINKERVVSARRCLRNSQTGGMRDLVIGPNDERIECISWVETEGGCWRALIDFPHQLGNALRILT